MTSNAYSYGHGYGHQSNGGPSPQSYSTAQYSPYSPYSHQGPPPPAGMVPTANGMSTQNQHMNQYAPRQETFSHGSHPFQQQGQTYSQQQQQYPVQNSPMSSVRHSISASSDVSTQQTPKADEAEVPKRFTTPPPASKVSKGVRYELHMVQQPDRARMCGYGEKVSPNHSRHLLSLQGCSLISLIGPSPNITASHSMAADIPRKSRRP